MSAGAPSFVLPPQPLLATDVAGFALLTLAVIYAGLWWRDREPGMNWLAGFFAAFGLWWATTRWHLPVADRITQPQWLLLPLGGIAALMVGLVRYLEIPAATRRWLLPVLLSFPGLTVAMALASLVLPITRAVTSPLIALCVLGCVVLALDARRREPGAGHGIVAAALATLPLVIVGTLLSGADIVMVRFLGPLPLIFFGVVLLTVSLLRRRRAMEAEIARRAEAESALAALNASLEQQVQQRTAELSAARDEADRANAAKSDFLSSMSHELRTPLNAVLGFGQLLQSDARRPLAQEHQAYVGHIVRAGHHLLTLINEVLDLARVESGHFTISPEPVLLPPLIEECLTLVRPLAQARGIRIDVDAAAPALQVRADRVRLRQVLLNLLSNAIKYNRAGGSVQLSCAVRGTSVELRVRDEGAGITPEQQARLFKPFERLDADPAQVEGTGLGLALTRKLLDLMGGEIGLESLPGVGSTFWVRLPVAEGAAPAAVSMANEQAATANPAVKAPQWKALYIEDNPINLLLVEQIVARRGDMQFVAARTPAQGLALAATDRPDVILLDINLPEMDGYGVLACLLEHPVLRDVPVVAISANAMPQDLARGEAAGFHAYLTKPLDVALLSKMLDKIVAIKRDTGAGAQAAPSGAVDGHS